MIYAAYKNTKDTKMKDTLDFWEWGSKVYKLWYTGNKQSSNGIGIMMKQELADRVIIVNRNSNRLMSLKLVLGDTACHVF